LDSIFSKFTEGVRKIREYLRSISESLSSLRVDLHNIKDSVQSIDESARAYQEKEQPKPEVVAIVQLPEAYKTESHSTSYGAPRRDRIRLLVEWLTLFAVIFYGFVAYRQWKELIAAAAAADKQANFARKTFAETRENFRLDQRPWLGVLEMDTTIPSRETTRVKLEFVNSGKTPALNQHMGWEAECWPVGQKPKINYTEDIKNQGAIILPNQHFFAISQTTALCSEKNFALFKQGEALLTILGTIWYKDEFTTSHTTEFCLYLRLSKSEARKQPTEEKSIEPQVCDYHNSVN
jgi:hypothetical protein